MRLFAHAEHEKLEFLNHHNHLPAVVENDRAGLTIELSV
jgi:hypothetical protein